MGTGGRIISWTTTQQGKCFQVLAHRSTILLVRPEGPAVGSLGIEGVQGNFTICPKSIVTEDSRETLWVIEGKQEKKNQQLINRSTTLVPGKHPPLHPLGGRAAGQQRNLFQRLLPDDRQGLLSMDALAKTPPLKGH